jgi:hypothetical protein
MKFPWSVGVELQIVVLSLAVNKAYGGTDVVATFLDVPLALFTLGRDWTECGADALVQEIRSIAIGQIANALRLAQ